MYYYFNSNNSTLANNILLFVNGYRNLPHLSLEYDNSVNAIYKGDVYSYWEGINQQFIDRIGTKNVLYADGHFSVKTSNHFSLITFLDRYNNAKITCTEKTLFYVANAVPVLVNNPCYHNSTCMELSTTPNTNGFNKRYIFGASAASIMAKKIEEGKIVFNKQTDTLDIVCHSMGFAYAQGMIAHLISKGYKMGRYYIIAPENPSSGSVTLSQFKQVWQYGSNETLDPIWEQDGVAPQVAVGNLKQNRVFIPPQSAELGFTKNFEESHKIENYKWIFNIKIGENGFVTKRN